MKKTEQQLQNDIAKCEGALQELYELGVMSYINKNEELQLILTERISSKKGEKARLEMELAEAKEKAAIAA